MTGKRTAKIALKSIEVRGVDTYKFNHRKAPSGIGMWAFRIGDDTETFWTGTLSYTEAVKAAKVEAQKRGAWDVTVLP